jgi:hypothetical protein
MIRRVFVEDQEKVRTHHTPFSIEDLKSAVQEGRESERARIIAILQEAQNVYNLKSMNMNEFSHGQYEGITKAIELIEGESK